MNSSKENISETAERGFFVNKVEIFKYDFYLSGEIVEPEAYVEWFNIIRNAGQNDEIEIHINSSGGNLATALQFIRCMQESQALIRTTIEGECVSAATIIFLTGHIMSVTDNCIFMVHNYRGGFAGKGGEMYDNALFERKWSTELLKAVYRDFLTLEELESVLNGKDLWMDSEEVILRLEILRDARLNERQEDNSKSV